LLFYRIAFTRRNSIISNNNDHPSQDETENSSRSKDRKSSDEKAPLPKLKGAFIKGFVSSIIAFACKIVNNIHKLFF